MTTTTKRPAAERDILLLEKNPTMHPELRVPSALPGIVVFVHGVNDPGGNYDIIEEGLCEGLNERLDAFRLIPGRYGEKYAAAQKSKVQPGDTEYGDIARVKYDPDTYLYERTEIDGEPGKRTHSVFIPFYWGYRAADDEIAYEKPEKDEVARRYKTVRGQYQDIHGNRLSKHFAKGGGMFNNATNSIPAMFGPGFYNSKGNRGAVAAGAFDKYQFSGTSPHRRYMVLAAERLAMLVREIRRVAPDDTITIIGHSQGTLVTLLAQAMLADGNGQQPSAPAENHVPSATRCADTLVLVDSPYSVIQPAGESLAQADHIRYSARGKINTLVNIVNAITAKPHSTPPLAQLSPTKGNRLHHGRAGMRWNGIGDAMRRERSGTLVPFVERDNRGKVYMYFCPEDATVALMNIKGIGTLGVPDRVPLLESEAVREYQRGEATGDTSWHLGYPAMLTLAGKRFYQRVWTRQPVDTRGRDTAIGKAPDRLHFENTGECQINGEAIYPPFVPEMYGGEIERGSPTKVGKITPNDYTKDLAIGNRRATFKLINMGLVRGIHSPAEAQKAAFNNGKEPDDQTYLVHVTRMELDPWTGMGTYLVEREETPNEARARMEKQPADRQENSYHSAVLSHVDNLRRVVAFDVAIGQAKALDDPDWRRLFIGLADWKMTEKPFSEIKENPRFPELSDAARQLAKACHVYYTKGKFPSSLVRSDLPSLIDAERR